MEMTKRGQPPPFSSAIPAGRGDVGQILVLTDTLDNENELLEIGEQSIAQPLKQKQLNR